MSGKKRSDIVGEEMGKMLLKGYRMLATSCDRCDCVIMQDKEGNQFCVNCMQDKEEAAASGPSGDVPDRGQVSGQQTSEDVKPAIPELNAAALDHKEQVEKIQREVELALMADIQRSAAELRLLNFGNKEAYLRHIRDCASTLDIIRNLFTTK